MRTVADDITYDELNRLHYKLGGVYPVVDSRGWLNTAELADFVYAVEQRISPKERVEIPGQLSLFDPSEYDDDGG